MALRAGYYGLKKSLLNKVKGLPGIKSIGSGLSLNSTTGELTATGTTVAIEANPEGSATDNLIKLGIGEDIYAVPDAAKTYQTDDATESAIVDADYIPFLDSSAASGAGAPKKSTWSNFKSKLKMVFDALYMTWEANAKTGVHNWFKYSLQDFKEGYAISGWSGNVATIGNLTITVNDDMTVTLDGSYTEDQYLILHTRTKANNYIPAGTYKFKCENASNDVYVTWFTTRDGSGHIWGNNTSDGSFEASVNADDIIGCYIYYTANTVLDNVTYKPMITDSADTDSSYQPYAMTNRELTENKLDKTPKILTGVSLNDITENGKYLLSGNISDSPISYGYLDVMNGDGVFIIQILYSASNTDIFKRTHKQSDGWSSWYKFTGTEISS